jgi:hypothetical protein
VRPSVTCVWLLAGLVAACSHAAAAEAGGLQLPKVVEAGSAVSIATSGSGEAVFYIVGPGQVLRRAVRLGDNIALSASDLTNAGHYLAVLAGEGTSQQTEFDVVPARQPAAVSFLAKPSRLPVDQHDGLSGVVYVFDAFGNLLLHPTKVSFQLSGVAGAAQTQTTTTRNGVAWVKMNSAPAAGAAQFLASAGSVSEKRIVQQVPGDPCNLRMKSQASGKRILLETEPVRDCRGNAVPDGTIVTFTEKDRDSEATVDVPLKRGVARTEMPLRSGAVISVATGVVMGNEIRVGGGQ